MNQYEKQIEQASSYLKGVLDAKTYYREHPDSVHAARLLERNRTLAKRTKRTIRNLACAPKDHSKKHSNRRYMYECNRASCAVRYRRRGLSLCGHRLAVLMINDRRFRRFARIEVRNAREKWPGLYAELHKLLRGRP
ncbi:hypothetical protein [Achromobacter phage shaaii_LB5]|nr:hypothetical protein [Achromobacter phage shaaii_LB5]